MGVRKALAVAGYAAGIDREPALAAELGVIADTFIADAEREHMKRGIAVSPSELEQYYRQHQAEFAVFSTPPGKVAPLVETMLGFHIARVDAREIPPFESVRAKLDAIVRECKLQALVDALVASAALRYDAAYFARR